MRSAKDWGGHLTISLIGKVIKKHFILFVLLLVYDKFFHLYS